LRRISALILLIILALSIGAGVCIIWRPLPFQPMSTPANVKQTLINGNITVDGEYFIQFTVPSDTFDITVSGNFSVLGEGTIRVIVVNATNFVSGFGLPTSSDSGQQSANYVNVTLAPGATYYLVYNNFVQWGYSQPVKIVNKDIDLNYFYT
jgi:hypothetical protein